MVPRPQSPREVKFKMATAKRKTAKKTVKKAAKKTARKTTKKAAKKR